MDQTSRLSGPLSPVALVTGAASGIGLAIAKRLAPLATGGLLLVDIDEAGLAAAADSLAEAPERVSTLAFDVADADAWRRAAAFIHDHYGRLDWAVANAGVTHAAAIEATQFEDWRRVLAINLDGAFLTLQTAMPLMRHEGGGAVVMIASASGLKAEPGIAAYAASKAGVLQLMRVAAKEGAPDRIRVNALAPGGVETPMWRNVPMFQDLVRETGDERAAFDRIAQMATPLGHYATADEIAALTLHLLIDAPSVTGAAIVVDGGYTL